MRRVTSALVLTLIVAAPAAAAEWVRVDTPNFVILGELGEKRTRDYAAEFERFREALGRVIPGAAARSAVPTLVFLFQDQRSFGPYRPEFNGKPIQLNGFFVADPSLNTIMLAATDREAALRTIYHEYSHLIVSNIARGLPVWLNEGLAEYYSTFEVDPNGRTAFVGRVLLNHLMLLTNDRLLPIDELVSVTRESPLYNEGARRSVFYAQSWALVHLLFNGHLVDGEPDRRTLFAEYVRLASGGAPPVDAWRKVFAGAKINQQIERYIARWKRMRAYQVTFDSDLPQNTFKVSKPDPRDVLAALGDLRRMVSPERAGAHVDAITGTPTAYVSAVRGLVKIDQHEITQAMPLLLEAVKSDDWLVRYRAAIGLERIANVTSDADADVAADAAQAAFESVLAEKPDLPHAIALRASLLGPGDEGMAAIKRARSLAPGRDHYAIWEAQFHLERAEFKEARAILAPLMSPLNPKDIREYARSVMGRLVTAETRLADAGAAERRKAARESAPSDPAHASADLTYVFRELKAGEQRIEGVLERVECPRTGLALHVRAGGRLLRFTAAAFDAVEFIAYERRPAGSISCGVRPSPDRIYLTFTPPADGKTGDGVAVAVEFIPSTR